MRLATLILTSTVLAGVPAGASAQGSIVEGQLARGAFLDESAIPHSMFGAGARFFVIPRLAIGPEVTHMRGPGQDRDWVLLANASIDLRSRTGRRVIPYVLAGAGMMRHTDGTEPRFPRAYGLLVNVGIGTRVVVSDRWFLAPEFRIGREPHWRFGVSAGMSR